jgi:hypothetical protein
MKAITVIVKRGIGINGTNNALKGLEHVLANLLSIGWLAGIQAGNGLRYQPFFAITE